MLAATLSGGAGVLIGGLAPTIAVCANYFFSSLQRKKIAEEQAGKVKEVHTLVNDRSQQQDARIADLEDQVDTLLRELGAK